MLAPLSRALAQLDDPVFLGVLVRSLVWTLLCFLALLAGCSWELHALLAAPIGRWSWLGALAGAFGTALLAFWLFLPVAAVIATLYIDRVAAAVDRRFYPWMAAPRGAAIDVQIWDGLALGMRVLLLNAVALLLALLLPGVGWALGWAVTAWAVGRGLFMAVAMRRMTRQQAQEQYRAQRMVVLLQGAVLSVAGLIPLLNLLIPVIGTAAMVHVLHQQFPRRIQPG